MFDKVAEAERFLKSLANRDRLMILCFLSDGQPYNVTALIERTGIASTSMSQHLSVLKEQGLIKAKRDHRQLFYRIEDPFVFSVMHVLQQKFCPPQTS